MGTGHVFLNIIIIITMGMYVSLLPLSNQKHEQTTPDTSHADDCFHQHEGHIMKKVLWLLVLGRGMVNGSFSKLSEHRPKYKIKHGKKYQLVEAVTIGNRMEWVK